MGFWNWLVGGDATNSVNPQLNHGGFLADNLKGGLQGLANQQLNFGQSDLTRSQMGNLAAQLQGVASGQQKGAGEMAVDRQVGQATAAQQAMANMARGANAALAARQAARGTQDLGVAGAGQAQMAALQDQAAARGQLAGLLGTMRQGDLSQQGLVQQQFANQNQTSLGYLGQLLGLDQAQLQAMLAKQGIALQDQGHLGALLQSAGQVGAAAAGA